jgi:predicted aminopeptidase
MRFLRLTLLSLAAPALSACATVAYYAQAAGGQLEILARARPIAELLDDAPATDVPGALAAPPVAPQLKARLATVLRVRAFATQELHLPDNGSYTEYADLERAQVAWNVVATPEFSLKPKEWCFPVAGCVPYRGYFARERAARLAEELHAEQLDVRIQPVAAYSTLGWFRDPVLNTQLRRSDAEIAGVIFHELAHQRLYLAGDAAFNESFATAVELEGLRRWLEASGERTAFDARLTERTRQAQFVALVMEHRARLAALYATTLGAAEMRAAKQKTFEELRAAYADLRARWGGYDGYDAWFAQDLNNAHLAGIGLYHQHLPAFQALLAQVHGDLPAFYRAARALSRLPEGERAARLAALGNGPLVATQKSEKNQMK